MRLQVRQLARFRVLGPLEVHDGEQPVLLPAGKQRIVLATLLLHSNRTVIIDELVEKLWHVRAPIDARGTVQKYVMRLRHGLGMAGSQIRTETDGYRIEVISGQLDLHDFEGLVRHGAQAADAGDSVAESAYLEEALGLWRGLPPLSNIPSESLQRFEIPPLVESYLQTLERRIDVDLALGRQAKLVAELTGLVQEHPLRERFWAQRMRALHGVGRQGDALGVYHEIARLLDDELGISPGAELRAAQEQILRGGSSSAATTVYPVAPGESEVIAVRQLPAVSNRFVGRRAEVDQLIAAFQCLGTDRLPLVVISGPPGVGKSTLAVKVAQQVAQQFTSGQLFADLRGHTSEAPPSMSEILNRFIGTLASSPPTKPPDLEEQVLTCRSLMAGRRMLVVLDNVRTVDQVRAFLPGSARCAVIVTSRNELAGLAVSPGAEFFRLGMLSRSEASTLLREELSEGRWAADEAAGSDLVDLCGGLPLALRIAATHLALRPELEIRDYVGELRRGDIVSALALEDDDEASLAAAFDQSYILLSPEQRRLLRRLSLIPEPDFNILTAAVVAETDETQAAAGLERLAAASLLVRSHGLRYQFHNLTRTYALKRCLTDETTTQRELARRRLFDHYIHTADSAARAFPTLSCLESPPVEPSEDLDSALDRSAMVAAIHEAAERRPCDVGSRSE